ncbi:MAG: hypothetical protein JXB19_01770 [Bacteroidales bacterium]|nr:hypothetical protein [Bacteroidales bacterium]
MKTLPTEFIKNDVRYLILEKSGTRYFAELYCNEQDGRIIGYETGRISKPLNENIVIEGREITFGESIIGNELFGQDKFEKCMTAIFKDEVLSNYIDGNIFDTRKSKMSTGKQKRVKVMV